MKSEAIAELIKEINQLSDYTFRGHLWARISVNKPSIEIGILSNTIIQIPYTDLLDTEYQPALEQIWAKLKILMTARDKGVDIYAIEDYDQFFNMYEILYED